MIFYRSGLRTGVKDRHVKFILSAGTYYIDDFNAKVKVAILQERQDCEASQVKDLKLVLPKHYIFMASNTFFIALGILDGYIEKTTCKKLTPPPGSCKTSLDT